MDWIVKTLFELGECPSDATKLLYPGCERFSLFEALLKRLLGTEGFEYLGLQAPSEEEAERVSCIHSALCILGFRCAECEVQGSGETAERVQFLERLLRFVQRVQSIRDAASNEGSSEALLATAADMQGAIFSEAVSLLPSDVKHAAQTFRGEVGSIEDLRTALQRSAGEADSAADATAQDAEDDGAEAWEAGERELEEQLARFSDLSKGFLELHREELACWMKGSRGSAFQGSARALREYGVGMGRFLRSFKRRGTSALRTALSGAPLRAQRPSQGHPGEGAHQ
eukprot:CAMPEP_0177626642 /NCGR_PEP_ID=MMETSP0419_2-20121207/30767_1 /TAXON_ID=582737 /ORGANISM="Tetraselmis sp., Strain GSL018" /LENGTH=284 /DNA_ID=CAMNT_0019127719 /DNA_START=272 /DNA_END=1127 /DNA_ORIENTATION=+